jgi:hypothetical protein
MGFHKLVGGPQEKQRRFAALENIGALLELALKA